MTALQITRSRHEGARKLARDIANTDVFDAARWVGSKVEVLFAQMKKIIDLDRFRLGGPNGAKDKFSPAATAQNLRKMEKLRPTASLRGHSASLSLAYVAPQRIYFSIII